jgi:predicted metal-dependent hydrolase
MRRATSKIISSSVSSDLVFAQGDLLRPLIVRRVANARRMRLAVDPRDGSVKLTLPRRGSERAGRIWAETQRAWIEQQLALLPASRPIVAGGTVPYRGADLRIDWSADRSRTVRHEGDRLVLGGPVEGLSRRVVAWLKREALRALETETRALAVVAGVTVARVAIGDPRARWGSCSSRGDIRYSWRLILAPPHVLSSTVAHEVAHRLHMDHSAAFRAAEARLLGTDPEPARRWLREYGASLYWIGCG